MDDHKNNNIGKVSRAFTWNIFYFILFHCTCARQKDEQLPGSRASWNRSTEPGPPYSRENSHLEPSRDGENMRRSEGEPTILNVMKEDQRPRE